MRQKSKNPKRCVAYDFQYPGGDSMIAKKRSRTTLLEEDKEDKEDKEERAGKNEDGCDQDENELERRRKLSKMGAQMLLLSSSVLEEENAPGAVPSSDGDVEDDANKLLREEEEPPPRLKPKEEGIRQNNNDADNNDNNIDDTNNTEIKLMIALQRSILLACTELPDAQAATAEARNAFLQMPLMNSLALALGSDAKSSFQGVSMDKITNHDVLQCVFVAAGECKGDKKRATKRNTKKDARELVNLPTRYVGPHVGEKCCRSCWHRVYRITNTLSLPFSCDICAETFKKEHLLTAHVRVEHEGKQAYLCRSQNAGKNFLVHGLVHTGERPYACAYCDQRFISSSNLNKHERQHTGFKPYSCRACLKKFSRSIGLRNHVQQQHLKDTSWSSSKVAVVEEKEKEEVENANIKRKKGKKNWGDKTTAYTAPIYVLRPPGETTNLNKNINKKAPLSESENSLELYLNKLAKEKETKKCENHLNYDDDESSS
ncbi:unnamed protein product [Bathycoccus prasinos]